MASGPKIVHKQFNSPIGLYSQNNIQDTLNKHLQNLGNGTVGIDFSNPSTEKPGNLANSAVLRMLEEEERNRMGYPKLDDSQKKAILETLEHMNHRFDSEWPPEPRTRSNSIPGLLNNNCFINSENMRPTKGQKKVVWPPVPETNGYHQPERQSPAPPHHVGLQQTYQPHKPQSQPQPHFPPQQSPYQSDNQPAYCEGRKQEATGLSKLIPFGPGVTVAPTSPTAAYRPGPQSPGIAPQPYKQPQGRWAPVPAPLSPQTQGSQPTFPQQQQYSPQPQLSPHSQYSPQYHSPQSQYSEPAYQPRQFEPPPTTITLREQPPIHQKPLPVFTSQPAAASFAGGVNMRGDQKWPPQNIREAVEAENEARRQLAKGPACRPRKVKKDYASFFAKNALNNNYPGYRAPPGTQHYEDFSGRSSY